VSIGSVSWQRQSSVDKLIITAVVASAAIIIAAAIATNTRCSVAREAASLSTGERDQNRSDTRHRERLCGRARACDTMVREKKKGKRRHATAAAVVVERSYLRGRIRRAQHSSAPIDGDERTGAPRDPRNQVVRRQQNRASATVIDITRREPWTKSFVCDTKIPKTSSVKV
jgi:hypothetical protein